MTKSIALSLGRFGAPVLALSAVALLILASPGLARPRGGPGGGHGLESRVERLDLDAETQEAVFAILDTSRESHRDTRRELHAAHERMRELLAADEPDEAAVMAQAEVLGALELAAQKQKLRTMLAIRDLLTAEQWEQVAPSKERDRHGPPDC